MSIISDAIRPFWLPGLHTICGRVPHGLSTWITQMQGWQVYDHPIEDKFVLNISEKERLLKAFASDTARMATAAFESISGVQAEAYSRKSTAWPLIRIYYSAFFAAHALMRISGVSCTKLEGNSIGKVRLVADLFGSTTGQPSSAGYFECAYDTDNKTLECRKLDTSKGSSHLVFWRSFASVMDKLSNSTLNAPIAQKDAQAVSAKLGHIVNNIKYPNGATSKESAFLTNVRNQINYRHDHGCWYPYANSHSEPAAIFRRVSQWQSDPMNVQTESFGAKIIDRFVCTCVFIVSLCHSICADMHNRCPDGQSFYTFTSRAFLLQRK